MEARLDQITSAFGMLGKYLLATGRVAWSVDLGFCATHVLCNKQARLILEADGHVAAAGLLEAYRRELDLGVRWPDSGWGSLHHFYHAKTGGGLFGRSPADAVVERYFRRAVKLWQRGSYRRAMFFLGAATHLLQDICEPHHARCACGSGHRQYEKWVQSHRDEYLVGACGVYKQYREPARWLKYCARKSYEMFDLVGGGFNARNYSQATGQLLPLTQRVTAGFWLNFLEQVGAVTGSKSYIMGASLYGTDNYFSKWAISGKDLLPTAGL